MKPLDFLKTDHREPVLGEEIHADLMDVFKALVILSPHSFRIGDQEPIKVATVADNQHKVQAGLGAPAADYVQPAGLQSTKFTQPLAQPGQPLVDDTQAKALGDAMWPQIYHHFYARSEGAPDQQQEQGMWSAPSDPQLLAELSKANQTRQGWDSGWRVYQIGQGGLLHVSKGSAYRVARPGEYVFHQAMRQPQVGESVDMVIRRESTMVQTGYYHAFGQTANSEFDDADTARLYFNLDGRHAPWLLETLSGTFNLYRIPFRFKCPDASARFQRADGAVLYVARRHMPVILRLLGEHKDGFAQRLRPEVPLFTKKIAPGLGGADDPGTGESFGQSRAKLLADGVIDAWRNGLQDVSGRLRAVHQRFCRLGLRLAQPFLNEQAKDVYLWPR